jgi:hypothetical protein
VAPFLLAALDHVDTDALSSSTTLIQMSGLDKFSQKQLGVKLLKLCE